MTYLHELLAQYTATHWQSIDDDARAHLAGFVAFAGHLTAQALPGESGSPMDMPILAVAGDTAQPMDVPAMAIAEVQSVEGEGQGGGSEPAGPVEPTPEVQR